jgi:subtilisin family serine protease
MAADEAFPTKLPAVMAGLADKAALTGIATAGGVATIGTDKSYVQTRNSDIMAGFSSQGPTDVDFRVKPDVVAPGVNVLSSIPGSFCDAGTNPDGCWAFFSGTSMASPHLAGTAAVVRQAHPLWDAWQVRSAITNTAQQGVLDNYKVLDRAETDPVVIGAGLEDVDAAVTAQVALSSVSTSFGAVPSGSGKALSRTLTLTSLTGAAQTLPVSVKGDDAFSASPSTVVVPAQGSVTLTVSYSPTKAVAKGDHSATLDLGGVAHAVLYAFAK